jgi:predicted nucleic acid-binding protein
MNIPRVIIETGIITLYLSSNPPETIIKLIEEIKSQKIIAETIPNVYSEAFRHICVKKGKEQARTSLYSFQAQIPIDLVELDLSLACNAGLLKCQHREKLSFTDCALIALALNHKATLYTTEKDLSMIENLKVKYIPFSSIN